MPLFSEYTRTLTFETFHQVRERFRNASVAVLGSTQPWYEAMALTEGARRVVTIEHNAVSYRHPALHAYTHRAFFASKERPETFDVILSISSFEHDGLGRYGDPLDPDGDLRSMKEAHKFCGRGGGCNDTGRNWRYPSHGTRLYGMHTACTAALFSASSSRAGKWSAGWAFTRRCSTSLSRTRNSRC